jgi:hypothetical protein
MTKWRDRLRADGGVPLTSAIPDRPPTQGVAVPRDHPYSTAPRGGWASAPRGHMCLPPNVYQDGDGPGSLYTCFECAAVWQAIGIQQANDEYRPAASGQKMFFGPKMYKLHHRGNLPHSETLDYEYQEGIYDWRDPSEVVAAMLEEVMPALRAWMPQPPGSNLPFLG